MLDGILSPALLPCLNVCQIDVDLVNLVEHISVCYQVVPFAPICSTKQNKVWNFQEQNKDENDLLALETCAGVSVWSKYPLCIVLLRI